MGLGGSINITFACNGCHSRNVCFKGSAMVEHSRRTVVGLALAVAFVVTGHGFAKFNRALNQCLGIQALSKNRFYEVITSMYPHVQEILNGMCEEEKDNMKGIEDATLGSWKRAVVTSDGVWHTRGHFSKNGSFIIKNYLTGGLLYRFNFPGDRNCTVFAIFHGCLITLLNSFRRLLVSHSIALIIVLITLDGLTKTN